MSAPLTPEREQAIRDEVLGEVVAWLVKKAREHRAQGPQYAKQADVIGQLASKVRRGAVRPDNLRTLPPGEEPAPEDAPALAAEVERLRAELADRRAVAYRDAAEILARRGYAIPADLLHIKATAAERVDAGKDTREGESTRDEAPYTPSEKAFTQIGTAAWPRRAVLLLDGLPPLVGTYHGASSRRLDGHAGLIVEPTLAFTDEAAECAHAWTTALDGDDQAARDAAGRTWEHCGICGVPKDVAAGKDTPAGGESTRAADRREPCHCGQPGCEHCDTEWYGLPWLAWLDEDDQQEFLGEIASAALGYYRPEDDDTDVLRDVAQACATYRLTAEADHAQATAPGPDAGESTLPLVNPRSFDSPVQRAAARDLNRATDGRCTECGERPEQWCPRCAGCACPDGRAATHAPGGSCSTAPAGGEA